MFSEGEPTKTMFVDMGASAFSVSVVFFVAGKLQVSNDAPCYLCLGL
jgi:hypothetical protein